MSSTAPATAAGSPVVGLMASATPTVTASGPAAGTFGTLVCRVSCRACSPIYALLLLRGQRRTKNSGASGLQALQGPSAPPTAGMKIR